MDSQSVGMSRKQYMGLVTLTMVAGFLGGMMSGVLLNAPSVQAVTPYIPGSTLEPATQPPAVVNVPSGGIEYRTPEGRIVARLYANEQGGHYEIFNRQGVAVAHLSASAKESGNLTLYSRSGHPVYSASGE